MEQNIEDFLLQDSENILRIPFKHKEWVIKPVTVAQMAEINPYIAKITMDDLDNLQADIESGRISKFIDFYNKYSEDVTKIVNTLVGEDISKSGATFDDYMTLLLAALYRLGGKSFLKSISLLQKLSLQTPAGLIAAQKRYTTSQNYL